MTSSLRLKVQTSRINDFMYDPNFIVPTEKDHNKHAFKATMATAQVEIAPIYDNMFSELSHCPRKTIVMKVRPRSRAGRYISQANRDGASMMPRHPLNIAGGDRTKFFKMPTVTLSPDLLNTVFYDKNIHMRSPTAPEKGTRNRGIQTLYRESSAQTTHWKTPNYTIIDNSDPEILKLNFLEENLPPGMHEVEIIIRARRRRAWEQLLPDVEDAATLEQRRLILQAIELDLWAFREEEIAAVQALRLELLERMLQEVLDATATRTQGKVDRITERLQRDHQRRMHKMKHTTKRELRRLYRMNFGISTKYRCVNVVDEFADYRSEVYAPLMRHGAHPKRFHESIRLDYCNPMPHAVEHLSTLPRWLGGRLPDADADGLQLPGRRLCVRETRWTEPVLRQLHEELLNLNQATRVVCTLRERKAKPQTLQDTMCIVYDPQDDVDEQIYEAVLILQCVIRGRAAQTLIYEGRDRCRELIEELQSTYFLDLSQYAEMRKKRMETLGQQRLQQVQWEREAHVGAALGQLQGQVVGTMLDFLSKELVRIRDERKAHALALLYERERRDREAAEAGRRQAEERRRREHDEMFKQVVKVHQDTVDLYLQDIVLEGIKNASVTDAKQHVKSLAAQIEEKAEQPPKVFMEKEELIADMVCQFLLPEVEKKIVRDKVKKRQHKYLRCAHETIFKKMDKLPNIREIAVDQCFELNTESTSGLKNLNAYLENVCAEGTSFASSPEQLLAEQPDVNQQLNYTDESMSLESTQTETETSDVLNLNTI